MAKRKNWVDQLVAERYFVWAVVFAVIIGGGVLGQIAVVKVQLDSEASSAFLTVRHTAQTHSIHKK